MRLLVVIAVVGLAAVALRASNSRTVANAAYDEVPDPSLGARGQALQLRGRALRVAFDDAYVHLRNAHLLRSAGDPLTRLVTRYVPVGSPGADARLILHFAGFHDTFKTDRGHHELQASIDPYVAGDISLTIAHVSIVISGDADDPAGRRDVESGRVERIASSLTMIHP